MTPSTRPLVTGCIALVLLSLLAVGTVGAAAVVGDGQVNQANEPPVAEFAHSPSNPEPGETVVLNASASADPDGEIATYEWDFDGDGETDAEGGPNRRIAFPSAGTYSVGLTVVDNDGATDTITRDIVVVGDQPPVAQLNVTPTDVAPDETVTLDATGSSDPDGQIVSWEFDTDDDGTFDETFDSPATLRMSFADPGSHPITLRVTDSDGLTATTTATVTVEAPETTATETEAGPATASPSSPASEPADGGGAFAAIDRLLPGGQVAAGFVIGLILLLVVASGIALYWQSPNRGAAPLAVGPLGSTGLGVGLVALTVGLPIFLIRGRVPTVSGPEVDVALALLELAGLALVSVLLLLLGVLQYTRERAEAFGPLSLGEFRWLGFAIGFVSTAALTVGIATLVLALDLSTAVAAVAWIAVAAVAVVPLTLALVLVFSTGGQHRSAGASGWL